MAGIVMEDDVDMDVSEALNYFDEGHVTALQTKLALNALERHAKEEGLEAGQITSLLKAVGSGKIATQASVKLIRCLIPREHVEQEAVLKVISSLSVPTIPTSVKIMLLKWTILVFELLDGEDLVGSLYDVLFYFLDSDSLRPFVCQLLCFLTKREHVMDFRVHKLLEMLKKVHVNDQPICSLLWAYKVFRPDLLTRSRPKSLFGSMENALKRDIKRVQAKRKTVGLQRRFGTNLRASWTPPSKRRRVTGRAVLATSRSLTLGDGRAISLSQLAENLENFELPSQVSSSLDSPMARHLLTVAGDGEAFLRLTFWLEHCLSEVFFSNSSVSSPDAEHILDCLVSLTEFLQDTVDAVQHFFLCGYLPLWDGVSYRQQILQLMTYLRPEPFDEFRETYILPLHRLFCSLDVSFKADVLFCWQRVLHNLLAPNWKRRDGVFGCLLVEDDDVDRVDFIRRFVEYVDGVCISALQVERNHPHIQSAALSFIDAVSDIYGKYEIPLIILPSPAVVCRTVFALNVSATTGMCRILVDKYRPAFEKVDKMNIEYVEITKQLNSYIVDLCYALWRKSAFYIEEEFTFKTLLYDIPQQALSALQIPRVQDALLVHTGITFLGLIWDYLQTQQSDSQSMMHPRRIPKTHRVAYLNFLREHNMEAIDDFLSTFTTLRS
ncbi:centromere protein I-like [Corticium candelabrum]|uniref:centromere protein I-like n=1 Tax=Corticium candelabrum TaxID=121492 RepID=UPI002E270EFE|nr:centromere protein I-like [Corticium candelabrum]